MADSFQARTTLQSGPNNYQIWSLKACGERVARLPYSLKILLENLLRFEDGTNVRRADIEALLNWDPSATPSYEIPFTPARVIMQDFTGVPAVVDLAAMREAMQRLGGDPEQINPLAAAELVVDHSVQVDRYGSADALAENNRIEFERNGERYAFLRWGQSAFRNFKVVPPNTGIVHQVNLEYLGRVVFERTEGSELLAYPDTLVGTDSHTTMINGLGVLGWGVGGIEAEAAMLGQPVTMLIPQVVGFKVSGSLRPGATATDLVLTVTELLRKRGVVDKFVEFFGDGLANLPLADRATLGNMSPEFGSTCAIFPIDEETLRYLALSGRPAAHIQLVGDYARAQGLWRSNGDTPAQYSDVLELDLGTVEPSLAGPSRPQDRVPLRSAQAIYERHQARMAEERARRQPDASGQAAVTLDGKSFELTDGAVLIAAITSCTNTSNPSVMLAAGLLARNAQRRGLGSKPWVKTSLAPGSRVVTSYLERAGLLEPLAAVGFDLVGYGCTTCIAEGSAVLLADGTSRKIESLPSTGGTRVFGPTAEGRLATAVQNELMVQGVRECVSLQLQDGRTLVCTPDHKILRADGQWIRADELLIGRDRVLMGLEAPIDAPAADEARYELQAGALQFTFATELERTRTLAFGRLLGRLIGEGSVSVLGAGPVEVERAIDRDAVLQDIELVTGERPTARRCHEGQWSIALPPALTGAITALAGGRAGSASQPPAALPAFIEEPSCPVALVREFLGALFGAAGDAPVLQRHDAAEDSAILLPPALSQTAPPEHLEQRQASMQTLIGLLNRCGVKARGARIEVVPTGRSACSYAAAGDGVETAELRLQLTEGLSFVERVGFRYCVDKSLRASAAAVYWRSIDRINRRRLWMSDQWDLLQPQGRGLSFSHPRAALAAAQTPQATPALADAALLQGHGHPDRPPQGSPPSTSDDPESGALPSPLELLEEIGAREWLAPRPARSSAEPGKPYGLDEAAGTVPALALRVIERRAAGARAVFDIAVDQLHAFVAGGVCVHNCIGNSGPLRPEISAGIKSADLIGCAVLSGNRNFEGRVHPEVRMNFLASPPLVVAYALAGTLDIDLERDPLGLDAKGHAVYLSEIWPQPSEVADCVQRNLDAAMFRRNYGSVFDGDERWKGIQVPPGKIYAWSAKSTYVKNPPYFEGMTLQPAPVRPIERARVLALLGDSVTTDHISPAGNISKQSPAARYLMEQGVQPVDFNQYGARRGNHEVMMRGTFANIRLHNLLLPGTEGGITTYLPTGEQMSIYDAAMRYKADKTALIIIAGKEYGTGSSRDWAAKGTMLLGVRAVLAESFERIHRSNLIGMGVLPLQFVAGQNAQSLGLSGRETYEVRGFDQGEARTAQVIASSEGKAPIRFEVRVRIDTPKEREYFRHGGILQYVLRQLATQTRAA